MPGETGVTVVTTLVCFFIFAREAAGASSARHSLRPLLAESGIIETNLAQKHAARMRRCGWTSRQHTQNVKPACAVGRHDVRRDPAAQSRPRSRVRAQMIVGIQATWNHKRSFRKAKRLILSLA
jgi:hypothetical protein